MVDLFFPLPPAALTFLPVTSFAKTNSRALYQKNLYPNTNYPYISLLSAQRGYDYLLLAFSLAFLIIRLSYLRSFFPGYHRHTIEKKNMGKDGRFY
jgi:hypothetical protein